MNTFVGNNKISKINAKCLRTVGFKFSTRNDDGKCEDYLRLHKKSLQSTKKRLLRRNFQQITMLSFGISYASRDVDFLPFYLNFFYIPILPFSELACVEFFRHYLQII